MQTECCPTLFQFEPVESKNVGFFDVSNGIEEVSERSGDQVDHGDEGCGISVTTCSCASGLEQAVEALHASVAALKDTLEMLFEGFECLPDRFQDDFAGDTLPRVACPTSAPMGQIELIA